MPIFFRFLLIATLAVTLNACSKFKTYNGPEVTRLVLMKGERKLYLLHGDKTLKTYNVSLGFAPKGPKQFKGDGRTPEGRYYISRRNPNSRYHLSIGISYPNARDIARARKMGKDPGGDIFIHGGPVRLVDFVKKDWTWGCIAVSNREIEEIYSMVKDGTVIDIYP